MKAITSVPRRGFLFSRLFGKGQPQAPQAKEQQPEDGIYNYDIFAIERKEKEMLEKYPDQVSRIRKALDEPDPT